MLRTITAAMLLTFLTTVPAFGQSNFIRGDANLDGNLDIADPVFILGVLFGGEVSDCQDAMDNNDDGVVDIADPVYGLSFLFTGPPNPPAPFPMCGQDPTDDGLTCVGPVAACPSCFDSAECPPGFYCHKPVGDCDGEGVCMPIPAACPDVIDPVCGCDGITYDNECEAYFAGTSVAFAGSCLPPGACFDNTDCTPGNFCMKATGDCDGVGTCESIPFVCSFIFAPVCGCDDMTYSNECLAWAAGVSVQSVGPCP